MGRENARPRRQGAPGLRPEATNTILAVHVASLITGTLQVLLNEDQTIEPLTPGAFVAGSPLSPADSATFVATTIIEYQAAAWIGTIAIGQPWQFADGVLGIVAPQSGLIT